MVQNHARSAPYFSVKLQNDEIESKSAHLHGKVVFENIQSPQNFDLANTKGISSAIRMGKFWTADTVLVRASTLAWTSNASTTFGPKRWKMHLRIYSVVCLCDQCVRARVCVRTVGIALN